MSLNRYQILEKPEVDLDDLYGYICSAFGVSNGTYCRTSGIQGMLGKLTYLDSAGFNELNEQVFLTIFINELVSIIDANLPSWLELMQPPPIELYHQLETFISKYVAMIKHSPELHFHYRPTFFVNRIIMDLAMICARGLGKSCSEILYPELDCHLDQLTLLPIADVYRVPGMPLVRMNFVLSECGKYCIDIFDCLEAAMDDGVLKHTQKPDNPALTEEECRRVLKHNKFASELYDAITERIKLNKTSPSVGAAISQLIAGLNDGGANRMSFSFASGQENNAGEPANHAITRFAAIIKSLPKQLRDELYRIRADKYTFSEMMEKTTQDARIHSIEKLRAIVSADPRLLKYSNLNEAKENTRDAEKKAELATAIKHAGLILTDEERHHCDEYSRLLHEAGPCVRQTAIFWNHFLKSNSEKLYGMPLSASEEYYAVSKDISQRIAEHRNDLEQYLSLLDELIIPMTEYQDDESERPNETVLSAYHKQDDEVLYGECIHAWLKSAENDTLALKRKFKHLLYLTKNRPQILYELDIFQKIEISDMRGLIECFGGEFVSPVLKKISAVGQFYLDQGNCVDHIFDTLKNKMLDCEFYPYDILSTSKKEKVMVNLFWVLSCHAQFNLLQNCIPVVSHAISSAYDEVTKLFLTQMCKSELIRNHDKWKSMILGLMALAYESNRTTNIKLLLNCLAGTITIREIWQDIHDDSRETTILCHAQMKTSQEIYALIYQHEVQHGIPAEMMAEWMLYRGVREVNPGLIHFALSKGARKNIKSLRAQSRYGSVLEAVVSQTMPVSGILPGAVRSLIEAGEDANFFNPETSRTLVQQTLFIFLERMLREDYGVKAAKTSRPRAALMIDNLNRHEFRQVLQPLLDANDIQVNLTEINDSNLLFWVFQQITYSAFCNLFLRERFIYSYYSNIIHIMDALTPLQLRFLAREHEEKEMVVLAMRAGVPRLKMALMDEDNWNELLHTYIENAALPLRRQIISFLLQHPKVIINNTERLQIVIRAGMLEMLEQLLVDLQLTPIGLLSHIDELNKKYHSNIARLFCTKLEEQPETLEPSAVTNLRHQLMDMCFKHADLALLECIMQSNAKKYWTRKRHPITGDNLLRRAVAEKKFTIFKFLQRRYFSIDEMNSHDGTTLYEYICLQFLKSSGITKSEIVPLYRMLLLFEENSEDANVAEMILDRIKQSEGNNDSYYFKEDLITLFIQCTSLEIFKTLVRQHGGKMGNLARAITDMPRDKAEWFAKLYLECHWQSIHTKPASKKDDWLDFLYKGLKLGFYSNWQTRIILLVIPEFIRADYIPPDENDELTLLHYMIHAPKNLQYMVENYNANINCLSSRTNRTPLMLAAERRAKEGALCLLEMGADLFIKDNDGMHFLDHAASTNDADFICKLMTHHALQNGRLYTLLTSCTNAVTTWKRILESISRKPEDAIPLAQCIRDEMQKHDAITVELLISLARYVLFSATKETLTSIISYNLFSGSESPNKKNHQVICNEHAALKSLGALIKGFSGESEHQFKEFVVNKIQELNLHRAESIETQAVCCFLVGEDVYLSLQKVDAELVSKRMLG